MEASVTCPRFAKSVESQVLVPLHPLHFPSSSVQPPSPPPHKPTVP